MGKPRTYSMRAIVLRAIPTGDGALIVHLLSPERGRVGVIARGARKPGSKLVGHLEPLTMLDVSLTHGHDLDTVTQAQVAEGFAGLRTSLEGSVNGIYLAELADGFIMEDSPAPGVFTLLAQTLAWLCAQPDDQRALRWFELHLLRETGFLPELRKCLECRNEIRPAQHRYAPAGAGLICRECMPDRLQIVSISVDAVKVLRFLSTASLADTAKLALPPSLLEEVRLLLSQTLRATMEREVRSGKVMSRLAARGS